MKQRFEHTVDSVPNRWLAMDETTFGKIAEYETEGWELIGTHFVAEEPLEPGERRIGEPYARLMLFFKRPVTPVRKRKR